MPPPVQVAAQELASVGRSAAFHASCATRNATSGGSLTSIGNSTTCCGFRSNWIVSGLTRDAMLLSSSVDTACEHISLNMLLAMRDAASVVETARELQSLCQDFHRAAAGQDSLDSLRWDFRPLDVQWQQFGACFRDPISPELTQQLALVEENIQCRSGAVGHRASAGL